VTSKVKDQRNKVTSLVIVIILFAQNSIKIDSGYVTEQNTKAHSALTSAHNVWTDVCLSIIQQLRAAQAPKSAVRLSVPSLTFRTNSNAKMSKVKVARSLNAVTE